MMTMTKTTENDENIFQLDWGTHACLKLLADFQFDTVLDIGSGAGEHKRLFKYFGKTTYSVDRIKSADYSGDFMAIDFNQQFDAIWCSHVLEHQRNVGLFLDKIYDALNENGVLAITVPIHPRERLISGHLTSWSIPLLSYNLIMAGFDCAHAAVLSTYELALIVTKKHAAHSELRAPSAHGADAGHEFNNIEAYFPFQATQGATLSVEGVGAINWGNPIEYVLPGLGKNKGKDKGKSRIIINSKNLETSPTLRPQIFYKEQS